MTGLAEAIQGAVGQPSSVRIGIVESIRPPVVTAQGVPFEDVGFIGSYLPVVGDTVALLGQCSDTGSDPASWLVIGSVNANPITELQAGQISMTVAAAASATQVVTFPQPFAVAPAIATNITSGAAATANWGSRAITVSATGFTMFIFGPVNSFTTTVQWQAQAISR